jgi:3-hydroxybutyrate dehydrogenase
VLARAGARIAVHGLAGDAQIADVCETLENDGAPQAEFFHGDLRNADRIDELMAAVQAWGGADILVNNAGIQHTAPLADMPREKWDAILSINLSAAFHTMQKVLPQMAARGYGRVINIASVHGLVASKDKAPYVAAKFGLVGLSQVAALEYAASGDRAKGGVTVNCICPGWTETAIIAPQIEQRAALHGGDRAAGIADLLREKQPSQRLSDPSEIGELALWLCNPVAHNVTGTSIPIDGGWTAQ